MRDRTPGTRIAGRRPEDAAEAQAAEHALLALQRTIGNAQVARAVAGIMRENGGGASATAEAPSGASAPSIPSAPDKTGGSGDGYRQTWKVGDIEYVFSSGHGYRPEHKKGGPNIQLVAEMNVIEKAILEDLVPVAPGMAKNASGERGVTVKGRAIDYRYRKFAEKTVGIGTYFIPD